MEYIILWNFGRTLVILYVFYVGVPIIFCAISCDDLKNVALNTF